MREKYEQLKELMRKKVPEDKLVFWFAGGFIVALGVSMLMSWAFRFALGVA